VRVLLGGTKNDLSTGERCQPAARGTLACVAALMTLALLVALALPSHAPAARGLVTGFEDTGFVSQAASIRTESFNRAVDAQAGMVRLGVGWHDIAASGRPADPTNPGSASYSFPPGLDAAVRDARARGLTVLLAVGGAPDWAQEPGRPPSLANAFSWKPIPSDYADFMQAVAARYSGNFAPPGQPPLPAVQAIEVWNEVNSSDWLVPQYEGKTPVSPERYRSMLNLSYNAVKAVSPGTLVVAGATEPYGDAPGGARIQPVLFWQQLLCVRPAKGKKKKGKKRFARTGCPAKPQFDVLSHHPIDNTGSGPLKSGPRKGDSSTPDLGRIVRVLRGAEKLGNAPGGRHPVWATEFWWDSKPPNPVGAPLAQQARWIEQTFYLVWKAGGSAAINFHLTDSTARPDVHAGFQAGVYFIDGRAKPSLTAFRFPFVTERFNKTKVRAWGKSPAAGKLKIQRKQGKRWKNVKKLKVGKGSVFVAKLNLRGKQTLRAVVGGERSLTWKQGAGGGASHKGGGGSRAAKTIALAAIGALACIAAATAVLRRRREREHRRPTGRAHGQAAA
jgi:hypothetical protein